MALDGVTSFLRLKDVTITCKRMWCSLSIGGSSSVQWRKVGRSWRLRMCFRRLLCVRIEIDQLQCVNCWVIIHCLSVSCTKLNHSRCALVIWSLYNWPPNSELLLNNSLLELIYFLSNPNFTLKNFVYQNLCYEISWTGPYVLWKRKMTTRKVLVVQHFLTVRPEINFVLLLTWISTNQITLLNSLP